MRLHLTLIFVAGVAVSGCSVNDDLQQFRGTMPERISGLAWPALVPLGAFAASSPQQPVPDASSLAARAAALRLHAAALRARPVLDPARARALQTALRKYGQ